MALFRLLNGNPFRLLLPRLRRASRRRARRAAKVVPIIAGIPGTDVWFLRFALAFLVHLGQGGQIADRLRKRVVGTAAGRPFNFDHLRGGPLLWAPSLIRSGHFFIGHATCPGFSRISAKYPWWQGTRFCAPGYDYFHDGLDYAQVPVDLAPHAYAPVSVSGMEAAAWTNRAQRAVLIHQDPVEQAAFYFNYCRADLRPAYNILEGRRLADWNFRDYLFQHALPSYAKTFISYQAMATDVPGSVSIVPQRSLRERPAETLGSMLSHLTGKPRAWPMIDEAIDLARKEHLVAVEAEIGRPLDRARRRRRGQSADIYEQLTPEQSDPRLQHEAFELLSSLGVDTRHFAPPADGGSAGSALSDGHGFGARPALHGG